VVCSLAVSGLSRVVAAGVELFELFECLACAAGNRREHMRTRAGAGGTRDEVAQHLLCHLEISDHPMPQRARRPDMRRRPPNICRASEPTACTRPVRSSIATTDGSNNTTPSPRRNTTVFPSPQTHRELTADHDPNLTQTTPGTTDPPRDPSDANRTKRSVSHNLFAAITSGTLFGGPPADIGLRQRWVSGSDPRERAARSCCGIEAPGPSFLGGRLSPPTLF